DEDELYFLRQSLSTPCLTPIVRAEGAVLIDVDGRRIFDFHGNSVHQLGHGHPKVVDAIRREMETLPFCPRRFSNATATALARRLVETAPGDLDKVLFAPSGAAAISMALKLARYVFSPGLCWGILIERFEGCAMGQILHGSATTTEAVRRAIQDSQASLRALAKRYGINPKTVAKWKKRGSVADLPTGPKVAASTVLSVEEEAVIVAFRRHTLLPLDDCLYALQPTIPHLTRSSLHRCLQRHGVSRLPQVEGEASPKRKFKAYPIGYFHIDIAEVRTAEGKLYLLVAIDRTSKFAFVELRE